MIELKVGDDIVVYGRSSYDEPVAFADTLTVREVVDDEHGRAYRCEVLHDNGIGRRGDMVLVDPNDGRYPADASYPHYDTQVVVVPKEKSR